MTTDQIRIALAKWAGWRVETYDKPWPNNARIMNPNAEWFGTSDPRIDPVCLLPNYPADLNAVAELEKKLTEGEWGPYCIELNRIACRLACGNTHTCGYTVSASAHDRCLALVKTLNLETK